jgi:hypothetical protein
MNDENPRGETPELVELDRELYNTVMEIAGSHDGVEDFVNSATRFQVSIVSQNDPGDEWRTSINAQQERLVASFLRFLRRADPDRIAAVSHVMESWRKQERLV